MLSDIEIARNATLLPITRIASSIGLSESDLHLYGKYKAKISREALLNLNEKKDGKLVLVTAMNPTPAGEGKTTVSIGLAQGLKNIGRNVMLALREPSLGPVFGVKGGAAGGGYSQVLPMEDINLHFTGDIHAITAANNLLAALIDNHLYQGNDLKLDKDRILWKRCSDTNDRSLRHIEVGVGGGTFGVNREDVFTITAASEIMAILCLSRDIDDLKSRIRDIAIGYDDSGNIVKAGALKCEGAIAALLKDAMLPNLVQSIEHVPALIHGGPFANISFGCNTVTATKTALKLSDITITEAGFGADLGAFKFLDIKCRKSGLWPDAVVLVSTVRSLKYNGGIPKEELNIPNVDAMRKGFSNLCKHIENMKQFGIPVIVTSNKFPSDTDEELETLKILCEEVGASFAASDIYSRGGLGGEELASKVVEVLDNNLMKEPTFVYDLKDPIEDKIRKVATSIYGAKDIIVLDEARSKMKELIANGYGDLPICIAKTQYSLSDDPKALGRPMDFTITIRDMYVNAGAGYIVVLTGSILTMPGLPKFPAANKIDIDNDGNITGLF